MSYCSTLFIILNNKDIKKHFLKALSLDPQFSKVHYQLALIDNLDGNTKSAENHLIKSIELDLIKINNFEKRANIFLDRVQFQNANFLFLKCQEIKNDCANSYYLLSSLYLNQKKTSDAKEALINSITLYPNFSKAHREFGILCLKDKNMDLAKKHLDLSLGLNYGDYKTHFYLGILMIGCGYYHQAEQYFLASLDIKPKFVQSLIEMANLKLLMKKNKEAKSYYKRAKQISKDIVDEKMELLINIDNA